MKTIFLFLVCFICVRVGQNSAAAALCESTVASRGDVYEFAPNNFTVIEVLNFEGTNGDNIELTFSSGDLDKYFKIVNDSLVVANSAALTRNEISPSGYVIEGVINCKVISTGDTGLTGDVEVDFHYTNMYNPVFTSENKTIVSENEPIGKTVVTLETTDEDNDALATPIYSIVSQDPTGYFQISGSNLEIKKELEYSSSSSHTVEVRVTDAGFNSTGDSLDRTATTTITVTVEDYDNLPPIFVQCEYASGVCVPPLYTVNISKNQVNSDLDSKIQPGKITAKDGDSGINATIVYSFINGVPSNYGDYFQIDPDTGTVSQTKEVSSISIFNIAVKATQANNAIQYAVTYLQIMVTEKDDYKPEFEDPSYKGEIVDNGDSILFVYIEGTKDLLRVVANDQDDNKTSLVYVVDPPYQITSEGNIFVQSSALTTRAAPPSSFTVKAINIDSQSTNRQSDPVTVTVAYTEVTTPNPTTTEMPTTTVEDTTTALDSTTAVDTTSITTPNPTTTAMDTTVSSTAEESTTAEDLDGMVSASLLYGVAGGLSAALFIAICIIIYLLYRQKNMKLEDTEPLVNPYPKKADQSNSTGSITHENQAYEEVDETQSNGDVSNSAKEDDSKVKMVGFVGATVVSDLNDVRDPSDASSLVSERSENTANEHHYEHLGDLEEERTVYMNTEFEKPEYENDYNRTDNNSLSNGHVLIEQSYPLETGDDDDIEVNSPSEFDDVPTNSFQDDIAKKAALVSAAIAATAVAAEASQPKENDVEEMKSNHKDILELSDDVIEVEAIIKDGLVSSTKIVTLKGLGEDGNDVKAVQKSLSTDMATTYDIHNWKEKLQVMAMLNELDHPNILKCHGQYEKDDCLHVAMAYAEHGSLKDYLKGHKELDANRLMYIIAGVGRGLQYLHAKNIVHGNLQARSVMLDANYNPMLTDIENTEVIQTDVGERNRWQALEVIDGQEKPTAISDVWSFGVLIWEIVSLGAVPYADVPSNMLAQHIKNSKLEKPEGCSESLYEIMESCWKDKATRLRPDIYEINAKISELLLEDSNDLIRLGFGEFGVDGKLSVEEQNLGGSTVWSRSSVSISEGSDAHTDYTAL